jgi:hypothetical protein
MTTVLEQPREWALNCPPPRNHVEARPLFVSRRFQVDFVGVLQAAHPLFQPFSRVSAIDPELAQPLDTIGKILGESFHQSETSICPGIAHHHCNNQPQRVDQAMALASFALLVAIIPNGFVWGRRLDTLGVHAPSGGLGLAPQAPTLPLAQGLQQARPDTRAPPALKIALEGAPVPTLLRQHTPLAARLVERQAAVEHTAHVAWRSSGSTRGPGGCRQQRVEQLPWRIGHICGIVLVGAHG